MKKYCGREVNRKPTRKESSKSASCTLQSPLKCVAGVTGSNLKKRIEAIMDNRSTFALACQKGGLASPASSPSRYRCAGLTNAPLLRAQAEKPTLISRFEVASIRRVDIADIDGRVPVFFPTGGVGTSDPLRKSYHGAQLGSLIIEAFGVRGDQIIGLGKSAGERYDIVVNIPEGATKEQYNVMLGNLLRDRLHLRFHIESRVIPVYALRVGKTGPKFKETARKDDPSTPVALSGRDAEGFPILPPNFKGITGFPVSGEIHWAGQDVSIKEIALLLEGPEVGRPIVDQTNLTGHYDFKVRLPGMRRPGPATEPSDPAPSVFTAVQEQLGLKLEPSNAPFDHLTVDSIDREPTEN